MKLFLYILLSVFLYGDNIKEYSLGSRNIKIPEYNNMVDISDIKSLNELIRFSGGVNNKVITAFYDNDYIKKYPNIEYPNKWATVLIAKNIENYNAKVEDYISTVEYIKKNNKEIIDIVNKKLPNETKEFNDNLEKKYNIKNDIKLNTPEIIQNAYLQGLNYYGYVYLLKIDTEFTAVGTTVLIYLNKRIFTMNIYYKYNNENDVDLLIAETKNWLNNIYQLNKDKLN